MRKDVERKVVTKRDELVLHAATAIYVADMERLQDADTGDKGVSISDAMTEAVIDADMLVRMVLELEE